jgi:hypothetical protein
MESFDLSGGHDPCIKCNTDMDTKPEVLENMDMVLAIVGGLDKDRHSIVPL